MIYGSVQQYRRRTRRRYERGGMIAAAVSCYDCLSVETMCDPCVVACKEWLQTTADLLNMNVRANKADTIEQLARY